MNYEDLFREHEQSVRAKWTEQEMTQWIRSLPDHKRNLFITTLKQGIQRGSHPHSFACKMRVALEAVEARSKANQPNKAMSIINFLAEASRGWTEGKMIADYRRGGIRVQTTRQKR